MLTPSLGDKLFTNMSTKTKKFTGANTDELTLKRGVYWIGDPGYVVPKSDWSDFIHASSNVLNYGRRQVFYCGTAYGDGSYPLFANGTRVADLPVDSGTLSIIPLALLREWKSSVEGGHIIATTQPYKVSATNGGFEFGIYEVVTDGSRDEETCDCNCPHCDRH